MALLPSKATTQGWLDAAMADANNADWCKTTYRSYCSNGRYTPPQCVNNEHCRDIVLSYVTNAAYQIEPLIKNLGLNFTLIWLGPAMSAKQVASSNSDSPAIYYAYIPSLATSQLRMQRITFPPEDASQYASSAPGFGTLNSPIATDLPYQLLKKVASKRFQTVANDAFRTISKMRLSGLSYMACLTTFVCLYSLCYMMACLTTFLSQIPTSSNC